mmetsp:Transcript_17453/g.43525  ORF Transcript_17453/g.43525 Transcript_17453/m.43525 type:complete len:406 (-) Transcript_17453:79-1296(-)
MSTKHKRKGGDSKEPLPQISESEALPDVASLSLNDNNEIRPDNFSIELSPLWSGSNKGWQLTWGIWHRLPREEQKKIALQHGLKSIGEFEEFVSLQQAVDDSEYSMVEADAVPSLRTLPINPPSSAEVTNSKKDDGNEDEEEDEEDDNDVILETSENPEQLSAEELMQVGGQILLLPSEILHQIFAWLPVDSYGTLALVSPHWKFFTRTEAVYKKLCERLYLNQSKRRQLHVSRFGGSYRKMLETRPRVRAAGGCYVLKYSKFKPIQRDMWCEIPYGAVLETVYYRYLYFHEDGRCLYALSNSPPKAMFPRIRNVILNREEHDVSIVSGWFQVQKYNCTVIAKQQWQSVKFEISIIPESVHGKFSELSIDRHVTSQSGDFDEWSYDFHDHKVPDKRFRFIKDARL